MSSSIYPVLLFDKLDEFMLEFEEHDKEIKSGVMVEGDAAAYALVWEYGNMRQSKPGPKTVLGTNPDGEMVWLSAQAPFGYIAVNEPYFWHALDHELDKAKFDQPDAAAMTRELERVAFNASKLMAEVVSQSAPKDSGDLADSVVPVPSNDTILDREDIFGLLILEGE